MLPDRRSNPGSLNYESGALPIALRGPATVQYKVELLYFQDNDCNTFKCPMVIILAIDID